METSEVREVQKALKPHVCDWCNEEIEAGTSYFTWFTFAEATTTRMHPECYDAHLNIDWDGDSLPLRGTFARGCWCGEKSDLCRCMGRLKAREAGE